MNTKIKIKIIRHSERLDYTYPLYWIFFSGFGQYWLDPSLTSNGHAMAKEKAIVLAKAKPDFDPQYIYTSPYTRTIDTANEFQSIFTNAEVLIEPLLSEYQPYFGHSTSIYPNGIPTTYNGNKTIFTYRESHANFCLRVQFIVSKLIEKHHNDIILVTHGEFIRIYANYIKTIYPELEFESDNVPYLTVLSFEYDKDNNQIIKDSVSIEQ